MSFLGSVGNMMKGSDLEKLFAEVYAGHSVIHMMSGKAFSRALHAHFLTESALMTLILTIIKEDENFDRSIIDKFFLELSFALTTKQQLDGNLNTTEFEKLSQAILDTKQLLSKTSRTVKLWFSYVNYVATIKKFIIGERISNWELHLEAATEMLKDTLIMQRVPDFIFNKCENFKKLIHGYLKNLQKVITQYVDFRFW